MIDVGDISAFYKIMHFFYDILLTSTIYIAFVPLALFHPLYEYMIR